MHGVQRDAPEHSRVQVAVTGPDRDVEVTDTPQADHEAGYVPRHHASVEDDGDVRAPIVAFEPVDDRVAADLLLAVAREPDVHRQLALGAQQLDRLQKHEQVRLVVRDTARVEDAVAVRQLERWRLPELERVGRLDVEVRVAEDGRRRAGVTGRGHLADDKRLARRLDHVRLPSGRPDALAHPLGGAPHVGGLRVISADRRDRYQLGKLGHEGVERRGHGRAV